MRGVSGSIYHLKQDDSTQEQMRRHTIGKQESRIRKREQVERGDFLTKWKIFHQTVASKPQESTQTILSGEIDFDILEEPQTRLSECRFTIIKLKNLLRFDLRNLRAFLGAFVLFLLIRRGKAQDTCLSLTARGRNTWAGKNPERNTICERGWAAQKMILQWTGTTAQEGMDRLFFDATNFFNQSKSLCTYRANQIINEWKDRTCSIINQQFFNYLLFCDPALQLDPHCHTGNETNACYKVMQTSYRTFQSDVELVRQLMPKLCLIIQLKENAFRELKKLKQLVRDKTCEDLLNAHEVREEMASICVMDDGEYLGSLVKVVIWTFTISLEVGCGVIITTLCCALKEEHRANIQLSRELANPRTGSNRENYEQLP